MQVWSSLVVAPPHCDDQLWKWTQSGRHKAQEDSPLSSHLVLGHRLEVGREHRQEGLRLQPKSIWRSTMLDQEPAAPSMALGLGARTQQ